MALKGWYPDPSGKSGHYRYWDGASWSSSTSTDPTDLPPHEALAQDTRSDGTKRDKAWLFALGILTLATILAVVFVLTGMHNPSGSPATEDTNSAKPTVSAWDETTTPTNTPPSTSATGSEWTQCLPASSSEETPQTGDGHRSGRLTTIHVPGWPLSGRLPLPNAYDVHSQRKNVNDMWLSDFAIGRLAFEDGNADLHTAAIQTMQCLTTSRVYAEVERTVELINEQITVDGHVAWRMRWEVYDHTIHQSYDWLYGDVVEVTVIDFGDGSNFGVIEGAWPLTNEAHANEAATYEAALRAAIDSAKIN